MESPGCQYASYLRGYTHAWQQHVASNGVADDSVLCRAESGGAGVPQRNRVQFDPVHTADRAQRLRRNADPRQNWCP